MHQVALDIFVQIVQVSLPFAIVFEVGNLIVGSFMRVAFGGKLWLGR